MKRVSVNVGFVTNSSSVIYYFPRWLLDHPEVRAFLDRFEIGQGFVGSQMCNRRDCTSFLVTEEQKDRAQADFNSEMGEYSPTLRRSDSEVAVIYGDEYTNIASLLCDLLVHVYREGGHDEEGLDRDEFH